MMIIIPRNYLDIRKKEIHLFQQKTFKAEQIKEFYLTEINCLFQGLRDFSDGTYLVH